MPDQPSSSGSSTSLDTSIGKTPSRSNSSDAGSRSGSTPLGSSSMSRSESQLPKQPMLHDALFCPDNPRNCQYTVRVDPITDKVLYDSSNSNSNSNSNSQKQSPITTPGSPRLFHTSHHNNHSIHGLHLPPGNTVRSETHQQHNNRIQDCTDDLIYKLSGTQLNSVNSHTELAKTAHGVRILAKNLNKATLHLSMRSVLIITKARDNSLIYLTKELTEWLLTKVKDGNVYVDHHLENSKRFDPAGLVRDIPSAEGRLKFWTKQLIRDKPDLFDLVITLGGDGTVLYASTLFQRIVPPILSFALGSLGFLTNFKFEDFRHVLSTVLRTGVHTNLRMRFTCRVHKANGDLLSEQQVLNELTVDRGPSPWVSMLELYGDGSLLTVAQADGLIVSTPTGSTAYSLSAGGSLVHPSVSAISVTPICPHTLSFRPILLPDSMNLKVKVPLRSRATAWAAFDGRARVELLKGYYVSVSASPFPFPTVKSSKTEYFDSVSRVLNWNSRDEQKSFVHLLSDKNKKSYNNYQRSRSKSETEGDFDDNSSLNLSAITEADLADTNSTLKFGPLTGKSLRTSFHLNDDLPTSSTQSLRKLIDEQRIKSPSVKSKFCGDSADEDPVVASDEAEFDCDFEVHDDAEVEKLGEKDPNETDTFEIDYHDEDDESDDGDEKLKEDYIKNAKKS